MKFKVSLAQINLKSGDITGNAAKILAGIAQARKDEIEGYQKFAAEMDAVMESLEAAYDEGGESTAPK